MPKQIERCEIALHNYNRLRFSFVEISAGEHHILTSDPWSFMSSHLLAALEGKRGANREKIERAIYYASLAEDFFRAAQSIPLPAKGTLYYYGMLDLVKCFLSVKGLELEKTFEHHGLMLPQGEKAVIEAKPHMKDAFNVFSHFCEHLGKKLNSATKIAFKDALSHIPEIHGIYVSLGHLTKRKLLPVNVEFQVNSSREFLFTEVIFDKEQAVKVKTENFLKGSRKTYFKDGAPRENKYVYRAIRRKRYSKENIDRIYKNILREYRGMDMVPILTRQGYRYYVDLSPGHLPQLAYALLAMFYLGSAARYRPLEVRSVLDGEMRPLVTEFVSLAPRQFLYQMTSLITGKECIIPYAAI